MQEYLHNILVHFIIDFNVVIDDLYQKNMQKSKWQLFIYQKLIIRIYGQEGMCIN